MIPASAAPDVQDALRDLQRQLDVLLGARNVDLHGRRIINAGQSVESSDYVTRAELPAASATPGASSGAALSYVAGAGISVSLVNGVLTITNSGVRTLAAGTAISVNAATGAVTVTNTGVTSAIGTANQITVSAATGAVTFTLPQSIATTSTPQFARLGLGAAADGTALLSVGGKLLALTAGTISRYNDVVTAGLGVPGVYAAGRSAAQTAAVASIATYTVGAADGLFLIWAHVDVNTSTTHSFTVTCVYTDPGGTSRTLTLSFTQLGGATPIATITNVTGAGPYEGVTQVIRCKAATAITFATTGTFTVVNYDVDAGAAQLS